ncbi:MAG TPA: PfkB family carbohydrate kinase [Candidatus Bathyarchaeia archaeon]|nr:PfkB family carbohydrate kinase [Candidatus Bathyarchaeia archaeon]
MFDIISVGHFSIDSIFLPDRRTPFVVLGGSTAYVSLAARRLESRVAAISKVGSDFPEAYRWWLDQEGVNLSGLKKVETASTTRFELKYSTDLAERTLHLKSKAPPIDADDLPNPLKAFAIHVAPIAGEVTYEIVEKLKNHADVLSLDPQGLVRRFDESGNISLGSLADSRILDVINVYKSSQSEIQAVTGQTDLVSAVESIHNHGVKIVLVTLGSKGALLSVEGTRYDVPACVPAKLVDPTGAGDAFISGFLSEYVNGENILRCACVGAATASFVVEGIGPTFFGDKTQVYQRARELYEKGIKQ